MSPRKSSARSSGTSNYAQQSQRPLVILFYLLPFVIIHELGAQLFRTEVAAFSILRLLMANLGVYGRGVPPLLLILTLLIWHITKKDRWSANPATLVPMALESLAFALPVFAISLLCQQFLPLTATLQHSVGAMWALSCGAGVYEELLFRLYLCTVLLVMFKFGLGLQKPALTIVVVIVSSILFSLYHYLGAERFQLFSFMFRTLAGVYFALLFSFRGFGITAGAHAFYDVIVVSIALR